MSEASSELNYTLSSTPLNKQSITVAHVMLEIAKSKCQQAMDSLDKIRKKQKYLDKITHNLLEKAAPSKEMPEKKRKSQSEENLIKKTPNQTIWKKN